MKFDIQYRPAFALAIAKLDAGETVIAEAGALVSMDSHVTMETSAGKKDDSLMGSLFKGLKRMVAGESFFQNRFTAKGQAGEVTFAPTHAGDIEVYTLESSKTLYLQSSSYVCSGEDVKIDPKWGGAKSFFGGEGLVMLKATGSGPIVFNSFGGIKLVEVDGKFTVDTGHIVAFEDGIQFKVGKFGGGWWSFLLGGEGLVCNFTGKGKLWVQTRNPQAFGQLIGQKLPPRQA